MISRLSGRLGLFAIRVNAGEALHASHPMNVTWRVSTPRWRRNPPVGFIRPCELTLVDRPPAGAGWLHEIKHDGFRILARKLGARQRMEPPRN